MTFSDHADVFLIAHGSSLFQFFSVSRDFDIYFFMLSEVGFFLFIMYKWSLILISF